MKLARAPQRSREQDLIPMINVVLLLLILYMAVGRITPAEPFQVTPPDAKSNSGDAADVALVVYAAADGRLALDGRTLSSARLQEPLRAAMIASGSRSVTVRADRALPASEFLALAAALQAAGVTELRLVTQPSGRPRASQ